MITAGGLIETITVTIVVDKKQSELISTPREVDFGLFELELAEYMGLLWDQQFDPGILVREVVAFVGIRREQRDYYASEAEIEMVKDNEIDCSREALGIHRQAFLQPSGVKWQTIESDGVAYSVLVNLNTLEEFCLSEQIIQGSVYNNLPSQIRWTQVLISNEKEVMLNSVSITLGKDNMLQFVNGVATKFSVEVKNEMSCSRGQH
ncbi:hypothetical protein LIER_15171 [Lithospermum erythrorhizon]|uniref:Uncharacterized protein n=1 Tax=Lithospermum erythrorhizon TaxID=34254 RepID=A0AAV3Q1U7_LITER